MKHQLDWLVPLLLVPISYFGGLLLHTWIVTARGDDLLTILLELMTLLLAAVGPIVAACFLVRALYRRFRAWRRSNGHFTKAERHRRDVENGYAFGYHKAQVLARALAAGAAPPHIDLWNVPLFAGEFAYYQCHATYARYYGLDGSYTHISGFYWGRPAFVLGGLAAQGLLNSSRRKAAAAASMDCWREQQFIPVIVTSHRFICCVNGRWASFDHGAVNAWYPEPDNSSLVLHYQGLPPVLFAGSESPVLSVLTTYVLSGQNGVVNNPGLQTLHRGELREWEAVASGRN
jgi:hypothetical protein